MNPLHQQINELEQLAAELHDYPGYSWAIDRIRRVVEDLERFDTNPASGFLGLLANVVETERLVVAGLSPDMPCRKMHENRHRAFREALSMATAYFQSNNQDQGRR